MALVKCEDCGADRSDQVGSACPNCGNVMEFDPGPMPIAPPSWSPLGLLLLLIASAFCFGGILHSWLFSISGAFFVAAFAVVIPFRLRLNQYKEELKRWEAMGGSTQRIPRVSSPVRGSRIKPVVGFVHPLKSNESNDDGCDDGGDSGGGDGGPAGFTGVG
jgi:hypothetical protein